MCTIPYARSLGSVYGTGNRIMYSNSFWLYPWMLGTDNERFIANTPAITTFHMVEEFHGQSSPELAVMELSNIDEPLMRALVLRWNRHYLGRRQRW